ERIHAAYWSAASCTAAAGPRPFPWGRRAWHVRSAASYVGERVSTPAGNWPPGSGKFVRPCWRMHAANARAPVLPGDVPLVERAWATPGPEDPWEHAAHT